jgi:hypothetical protein
MLQVRKIVGLGNLVVKEFSQGDRNKNRAKDASYGCGQAAQSMARMASSG